MAHVDSWISGFLDGEGSFIVYVHPAVVQCRLAVQVRADDIDALRVVQNRLGGSIDGPFEARGNAAPCVTLQIRTKADCARVVAHLDRYPLLAKKTRDYTVWREAVLHHATTGWSRARMTAYRDALRSVRQFKR